LKVEQQAHWLLIQQETINVIASRLSLGPISIRHLEFHDRISALLCGNCDKIESSKEQHLE